MSAERPQRDDATVKATPATSATDEQHGPPTQRRDGCVALALGTAAVERAEAILVRQNGVALLLERVSKGSVQALAAAMALERHLAAVESAAYQAGVTAAVAFLEDGGRTFA